MSAIQTEFPGIVRAVVTDIGIVTGMTGSVTEAVKCRALWDTGAIYSVISKSLADKLGLFPTDTQRAYTAAGAQRTIPQACTPRWDVVSYRRFLEGALCL